MDIKSLRTDQPPRERPLERANLYMMSFFLRLDIVRCLRKSLKVVRLQVNGNICSYQWGLLASKASLSAWP